MDEDRDQFPSEDQSAAEPIGRRLRLRRESMNLSLEDAARRLHLDMAVLQALESEDFSSLPGSAYIKGYLRSYAQMLGIDPRELIDSYQSAFQPTDPELKPAVSSAAEYLGQRGRAYAIGSAVALVLILVAAWWYAHSTAPPAPQTAETPGQAGTGAAVTLANPTTVTPAMPAMSSTPTQANGVPMPSRSVQPAATPLPFPASASKPASTALPSEATATGAVVTATPPARENPADERRLELTLTHRSWVQIDDAKHRQLAYGLWSAGTHRVLQGTPPFSVFLGYAQGVQISLDGQAVDIKPYIRTNHTARFHLNVSPGETSVKSSP